MDSDDEGLLGLLCNEIDDEQLECIPDSPERIRRSPVKAFLSPSRDRPVEERNFIKSEEHEDSADFATRMAEGRNKFQKLFGLNRQPESATSRIFIPTQVDSAETHATSEERVAANSRSKAGALDHIEKYSGLGIKNRCIPTITMDRVMENRRMVRLSAVSRSLGSSRSDWVTIAVLGEKSSIKESAKGKKYSIWKLYDLKVTSLSLFLFGKAHEEHWKMEEGSIVGLLNPKMMDSREGSSLALSVIEPQQLVKLGTSPDLARCTAVKKDGNPCRAIISKKDAGVCKYHVRQAYKNIRVDRAELNAVSGKRNAQAREVPYTRDMSAEGTFFVFGSHVNLNSSLSQPKKKQQKEKEQPTLRERVMKGLLKENSAGSRYMHFLMNKTEPDLSKGAPVRPPPSSTKRKQPSASPSPAAFSSLQVPKTAKPRPQSTTPHTSSTSKSQVAKSPGPAAGLTSTAAPSPVTAPPSRSGVLRPGRANAPTSKGPDDATNRKPSVSSPLGATETSPVASGERSGDHSAQVSGIKRRSVPQTERDRDVEEPLKKRLRRPVAAEEAAPEHSHASSASPSSHIPTQPRTPKLASTNQNPGVPSFQSPSHASPPEDRLHTQGNGQVKSQRKDQRKAHAADAVAVPGALPKPRQTIEQGPLKDQRTDQQAARPTDSVTAQVTPPAAPTSAWLSRISSMPAPQLGRGLQAASTITCEIDSAMARAIAKVKAKGGIQASKPFRPPLAPLLEQENNSKTNAGPGAEAAGFKKKLLEAFGPVNADAALAATSSNVALADAEEDRQLQQKLDLLEKKDDLAQRLQDIRSQETKAWRCHDCDYLCERLSELCKPRGHRLERIKAIKRWFQCKNCKNRCTVLNAKFVVRPCGRCGGSEFERVSMYREPKVEEEKLLPRGVEHGFSLWSSVAQE